MYVNFFPEWTLASKSSSYVKKKFVIQTFIYNEEKDFKDNAKI